MPCASYLLKVSALELPQCAKTWTFLQCSRLWKLLLINSSKCILHSSCTFLWMTDCHIKSLKKCLTRVIQHMKKVDHVSDSVSLHFLTHLHRTAMLFSFVYRAWRSFSVRHSFTPPGPLLKYTWKHMDVFTSPKSIGKIIISLEFFLLVWELEEKVPWQIDKL